MPRQSRSVASSLHPFLMRVSSFSLPSPRRAWSRPAYTCGIWPCLGRFRSPCLSLPLPASLCLSLPVAPSPYAQNSAQEAAPSRASLLPSRPRAFSLSLSLSLSLSHPQHTWQVLVAIASTGDELADSDAPVGSLVLFLSLVTAIVSLTGHCYCFSHEAVSLLSRSVSPPIIVPTHHSPIRPTLCLTRALP